MILYYLISLFFVSFITPDIPDEEAVNMMNEKKVEFGAHIKNNRYCILIDYSKSIFQKRLWLYDLQKDTVVIHCCVSHALKSGILYPTDFSDTPASNKTPKGAFITGNSYHGKFGYSMRLHGLEKGVNKNSFKRYITFHPRGKFTWSDGCFMSDEEIAKRIIDLTKNGCFMYVYGE